MWLRSRALTPTLLLLNASCYAYLPEVTGARPDAGAMVRLTLTDSGAVVLRPLLGLSAESVDGQLVLSNTGRYVVHASSVTYRGGSEMTWRGETLSIDSTLVSQAAFRQFSPGRTALFAGGVAAVLLGAHQIFAGVGQGPAVIGGSPGPTPQ